MEGFHGQMFSLLLNVGKMSISCKTAVSNSRINVTVFTQCIIQGNHNIMVIFFRILAALCTTSLVGSSLTNLYSL